MRDFNLKQMKRRCLAPITDFLREGDHLGAAGRVLIFRDNGSKILGVAHLDSVQDTTHFETVTIRRGNRVCQRLVFNGQLDDRLGVYLLLDFLPQLGLKYDLLLTEDEECCASTAMLFDPPRQYHWIFSFDREGEDVVLYDYHDNKAFKETLRKAGFRIGRGSYSDIVELEHLGCCGVNVGTGLVHGHHEVAHVDLLALHRQVARFQRFFAANQQTHFPHTPSPWPRLAMLLPHDGGEFLDACEWCGDLHHVSQLTLGLCDDCLQAGEGLSTVCRGCGWEIWPDDGQQLTETKWGLLCEECRQAMEGWEREDKTLRKGRKHAN